MTDINRIFPTRLNFSLAGATMMIEVDATKPGWGISNTGCNWCTANQYSDNVEVTAESNSTSHTRSTSMIIISADDMDDVEEITIEQSCKFNASNIVLIPQHQEHVTGCAVTCVAMCVCQTQTQFKKDGFAIDYVENWDNFATKYGYTHNGNIEPSLKSVYNLLKEGYPAVVKINDGSNGKTQHWVTIYRYTGESTDGSDLDFADFVCADPYHGDTRTLDTAMNFNPNRPASEIHVYKQKVC